MFALYDCVKTKIQLSPLVPPGSIGTIVMVYMGNPNDYEVEFVDKNGETVDILTVLENDLEKL